MPPNPFASRFIQPGAIAYQCCHGETVLGLANQFLALESKRGAIVGPHGSGKSTLIASLILELQSIQPIPKIHHLRFSSNQSSWRAIKSSSREWSSSSILMLDGYEQLRFWSRFVVDWISKARSIRLLVTAHQPIRSFETLWETSVDEHSASWVVEHLIGQSEVSIGAAKLLQSDDWNRSRKKHGQNLRESLFDMYDWWQRQCP